VVSLITPTPTNISTKSEPEMVKNRTLASRRCRGRAGSCRAGRTDQEYATRNAGAQALELAWVAQELDDLLEILQSFLDTGDIFECGPMSGLRK
jgi:hypothetical protein